MATKELRPGARKKDPITHSFALVGQLTGAAIGATIGVIAVAEDWLFALVKRIAFPYTTVAERA